MTRTPTFTVLMTVLLGAILSSAAFASGPDLLRRGPNRIELLSDTEHHGIEILLPGPAIVVRSSDNEDGGAQ